LELQERRSQRRAELREEHEAEKKAPPLTAKGRARQLASSTKGMASDELATIISTLEDRYEEQLDVEANETAAAVGRAAKDGTLYEGDDDDVDEGAELTGLE